MSIKDHYSICQLTRIETPGKGALQVLEGCIDVPFEIKRIYYITGTPYNKNRGMHAHKTLKQFLFCPYGAIKLNIDDGTEKREFILDNPSVGVVLLPCVWRDLIWLKSKSVLCVAASDYYEECDYIRNYDEFLTYKGVK